MEKSPMDNFSFVFIRLFQVIANLLSLHMIYFVNRHDTIL